jgi:hypothetical protein
MISSNSTTTQNGEELVKRVLNVAELLSKAIITKSNPVEIKNREKQTKTRNTKVDVSS